MAWHGRIASSDGYTIDIDTIVVSFDHILLHKNEVSQFHIISHPPPLSSTFCKFDPNTGISEMRPCTFKYVTGSS